MQGRNHGKYTKFRKNNPRAYGLCDYSGMDVRHMDMVRQMEYRGSGLVWTGFMVNPRFADEPNPQNLSPLIRLDPVPVKDPRPDPQIGIVNQNACPIPPNTQTICLN